MFGSLNTIAFGGIVPPRAPTIGTATKTGTTTATVSFTAPTYDGGAPITSYIATSSPSGITGTLNQSGSGTITVTGLASGTAYTFTVKAVNYGGQSVASSASNSITTVPVIGQSFGGGYYGGSISTAGNGVADYYLVVSDKSVGEAYGQKWGTMDVITSRTSFINGPSNSAYLAAQGASYEPATFCENLNTGGYTDWYLPAKNELEVCYYNLKPGTSNNSTSSGSNANAVSPEPSSTSYTTSSPSQTTATNFRTGASSQEFTTDNYYWTSTESDQVSALCQIFTTGNQTNQTKEYTANYTRAIRRVAI